MTAAPDPSASSSVEGEPSPSARPAAAQQPLYRERLLPGVAGWIVTAVLGSIFGLVLVPLNFTLALVVGAVCIVVAIVLAVLYSPVAEVRDGRFSLGRARIDVSLLGDPAPLTGEEWSLTIGQDFEPLAHHCIRGWVHAGLRIEVLDEEDPTTAWVTSTRRPHDLALAVRSAQQQVAAQQQG
ncbi:DUF3093 domain-containing protein [Brachybacterium alimentarium]|uniref:DUF3093 domain-containing protein n=1 Tax=Brachybacterium alimentarium TaxID=47845 RepID=UPI003FD3FB93